MASTVTVLKGTSNDGPEPLLDAVAALLREEIAGAYLQWMAANANAVANDAPGVSVEEVVKATAAKLIVPANVPEMRF